MTHASNNAAYLAWKNSLSQEDQKVADMMTPAMRHNMYLGSQMPETERCRIETAFSRAGSSSQYSRAEDHSLERNETSPVESSDPKDVDPESPPEETTRAKRARLTGSKRKSAVTRRKEDREIELASGRVFNPLEEGFCPSLISIEGDVLAELFFATRKVESESTIMKRYQCGDGALPGISFEETVLAAEGHMARVREGFGLIGGRMEEEIGRASNLLQEIIELWSEELEAFPTWSEVLGVSESDIHLVRFRASVTGAYKSLQSDEDDSLSYAKMAVVGHFMLMTPKDLYLGRLTQMPAIIEYYRNEAGRVIAPLPPIYSYRMDFLLDCLLLGIAFPPECGLRRLTELNLNFTFPFFTWSSWPDQVQRLWMQTILVILKLSADVNWSRKTRDHNRVLHTIVEENEEEL